MEKYLWVRLMDGTHKGARVDQEIEDGKDTRYAVTYLKEDGEEDEEMALGLVWQQERNTAVAEFTDLETLLRFGYNKERR